MFAGPSWRKEPCGPRARAPAAKPSEPATDTDDTPTAEEADESYQTTLYDHACLIVDEEMSGETRQKFFAHLIKRKYHVSYSQSPSQSRDKGLPA
jgi:hypothetical protein